MCYKVGLGNLLVLRSLSQAKTGKENQSTSGYKNLSLLSKLSSNSVFIQMLIVFKLKKNQAQTAANTSKRVIINQSLVVLGKLRVDHNKQEVFKFTLYF